MRTSIFSHVFALIQFGERNSGLYFINLNIFSIAIEFLLATNIDLVRVLTLVFP